MQPTLIFLFFAGLVCVNLSLCQTTEIEVTIKNGPIIGSQVVEHEKKMNQFLGIPYAKPPVGKLRFRKPVPVDRWNEPIRALNWPNNCYQYTEEPIVTKDVYLNQNFTEDCLYLNIWSPDINVSENQLRPVLVWIHGGGLILGSSSFNLYDGKTLSVMADAVVVSFNYRLSTIGFMYSNEVEDIKGNQGLWDQALALEWVNENIRYFGGDPKSITIMGESAGSWSVSLHILSPVSRNLFKNAIMMSGASNFKTVIEPEKLVAFQLNGLRKVGCASDKDNGITKQIVECMEGLEPELLDKVNYINGFTFNALVVADGQFLPKLPNQMLKSGDHKTNFNLLVSTVEDEGSFILTFDQNTAKFKKENPDHITLDEAKDYLLNMITRELGPENVCNETIGKLYFNGLNAQFDSADLFRKQVGIAYGDYFLACPTINFAKDLFRSNPSNVKVYQWHYKAKIGNLKMLCTTWAGTCHCDDLYPVFGEPLRHPQMYHNREKDISREVINFIKSFIRTGEPGAEQPEWLSYFTTNQGKDVVAPYYEISNQYKSPNSFKFNLKQLECETLWKH